MSEKKHVAYKTWKRDSFFKKDFPFFIELSRNYPDKTNPEIRFKREFWKISYIPDSHGDYLVNGRIYKYSPGTIILTHPDAETNYKYQGNQMDCWNVLFDFNMIRDDLSDIKDDFGFFSVFRRNIPENKRDSIYVLKSDHEMKNLILSMNKEFQQKDAAYKICIKASLLKLLILMMRQSAKFGFSMTSNEVVDHVDNFIQENFREEFRLSHLARLLGLSATYLCRIYRRETGNTIVSKLKSIRLNNAMNELKNTEMPISEICYSSGFNDLSYFYRAFRTEFGQRPGEISRLRR